MREALFLKLEAARARATAKTRSGDQQDRPRQHPAAFGYRSIMPHF